MTEVQPANGSPQSTPRIVRAPLGLNGAGVVLVSNTALVLLGAETISDDGGLVTRPIRGLIPRLRGSSRHEANPIPKDSVAVTKAGPVTATATATGSSVLRRQTTGYAAPTPRPSDLGPNQRGPAPNVQRTASRNWS